MRKQWLCLLVFVVLVQSQPPNDNCGDAIEMNSGNTYSGSTIGSSLDAVSGSCGTAITTGNVWYKFNSGANSQAIISTCSGGGYSSYDGKLYLYSGTCGALTCVYGMDDYCVNNGPELNLYILPNTDYMVAVGGWSAQTGTFTLYFELSSPSPSSINDQCTMATDLSANTDQIVTFDTYGITYDTIPTDCGIPSYPNLWYTFNSGSHTALYVSLCRYGYLYSSPPSTAPLPPGFALVQGSCSGATCVPLLVTSYNCYGTNWDVISSITPNMDYLLLLLFSSANSGAFRFYLAPAAPNDNCLFAEPIANGDLVVVNLLGATFDELMCAYYVTSNVWYTFYSDVNNNAIISSCQNGAYSDNRLEINLFQGTCGALTCYSFNTYYAPVCYYGRVSARVDTFTNYVFSVGYGYNFIFTASIYFELFYSPSPLNDNCEDAIPPISLFGVGFNFVTLGATTDDSSGGSCGVTTDNIWYTFNSGDNDYVSISTSPDYQCSLTLFAASSCNSLACVVATTNYIDTYLGPNGDYLLSVGGFTGEQGTGTLYLNLYVQPP